MADLSAFLSPADRAKLARQVGITLDDGRVFKRGVIVSAQDSANTAGDRARNAAFASQTGPYADRTGTVDPNQAEKAAYGAYLGAFGQPGGAQPAPQPGMLGQNGQPGAPRAGGAAPSEDLLNRARLLAQYQSAPANTPQFSPQNTGIQMAAGPNISTAPTYLPQGSIGAQSASGAYTVQTPGQPTQSYGSEQEARMANLFPPSGVPTGQLVAPFQDLASSPNAAQPVGGMAAPQPAIQRAPVPAFLPGGGGYTPQQITAMSPEQRGALVAFNAEQAAAKTSAKQADLERRKVEADIAANTAPKPQNLSLGEQTAQAQIDAFTAQNKRPPSAQERADILAGVLRQGSQTGDPEQKVRVEQFSKDMDTYKESGRTARRLIPNVNRLEGLFDAGLQTGKLEQFKTEAAAWAKAAGVPVDEKQLAASQEAGALLGQSILEYFQQTKGAITERENQLFASFGPQFGKTPEANKALIGLLKNRLELDRDLETIVREGNAKGLPFGELQERVNKRIDKFDSAIAPLQQQSAAPAAAPSAAQPANVAALRAKYGL